MFKKTLISISLAIATLSQPVFAQGFSENVANSVHHSGKAVSAGATASAQLGSAVLAVPLLTVGAIGSVAWVAGEKLTSVASDGFAVGDETVTAMPAPDAALGLTEDQKRFNKLIEDGDIGMHVDMNRDGRIVTGKEGK